LEPIERATNILSGTKYPTIADMRFYFNEIRGHLNYCIELNNFDQYMMAASINRKLEDYWIMIDDTTTIASILDPRTKLSLFELGEPTTKAINALREQFSLYFVQKSQLQISSQEDSTSPRNYFHQLKKRRLGI